MSTHPHPGHRADHGAGHGALAAATVDARLQALHERLTAAVADLTRGEAWQRMLSTAARLPHYSPHNVLLITAQHPGARAVAGFHTWQQLGRQVRKGEKGIGILAPVLRRRADPSAHALPDGGSGTVLPSGKASAVFRAGAGPEVDPNCAGVRHVAGFRVVHVFDISQTDGADLPTVPAPVLLDGQAPAGLYDGLAEQVRHEGFQLIRHDLDVPHLGQGKANGLTDFFARTVIVAKALTDAQATKTLAHELGHVLLHRPETRPDGLDRPRAEVEAESVAYVVAAAHGLSSQAYTVPYVTGWAGGDLTLLQHTAERVLSTAQAILTRTPPPAAFTLPDDTGRRRDQTRGQTRDRIRERDGLTRPGHGLLSPALESSRSPAGRDVAPSEQSRLR